MPLHCPTTPRNRPPPDTRAATARGHAGEPAVRWAATARAALLASLCLAGVAGSAWGGPREVRSPQPVLPPQVVAFMQWMEQTRDNEGMSFAVIDKTQAQLWLFDPAGQALGSSPVLLGWARGDASVPGIGERPMAKILPHERTTPAGRFPLEPGRNASGEDVLWVDYHAAVSMHRVRATLPTERRLQRLATASAADNRISYGCINVPRAFYDQQLKPRFVSQRGVLYLLPETMPLTVLFTPPKHQALIAHLGR